MDTELFELNHKVYDLTGWASKLWDTPQMIAVGKKNKFLQIVNNGEFNLFELDHFIPLYTSDYLLEKLPKEINDETPGVYWNKVQEGWCGDYGNMQRFAVYSDTPLKALLKLTIALHEAGELK